MKYKLLLILSIAVLICQTVYAEETVLSKANEYRIDLVRFDPAPVTPGSEFSVWFEITNLGDQAVENFDVTMAVDYPFKLKSDKVVTVNKLEPGEKAMISFVLKVNPNAVEGDYSIALQYYSKKLAAIVTSNFNVEILNEQISMDTSVEVFPSVDNTKAIEPGKVADVKINVQNKGMSAMKDVVVKLDLSADSIPFAPFGMTTEKKLSLVPAGSDGEVEYKLIASPDADAGLYKIPVTISYYDEKNNLHETEDLISLVIGGEPSLDIEITSEQLTTKQPMGIINIKVINSGTTDVKFAQIILQESSDYEIISSPKQYIGDIDSDDYETVDYRVKLLKDDAVIKAKLVYRDANNNKYEDVKSFDFKLYDPEVLGLKRSKAWLWVLLVVLAVVGYFVYRKVKRHN